MKIGLGIGIPFIRNYVSSIVFDPSKLFTGNTNGAWYDPSDITTLYRDAAGTQPVTAVEQPVGLMLDKSKNGVGTNGAKRVNLLTYTEQFDDATAWSKQIVTCSSTGYSDPFGGNNARLILEVAQTNPHYIDQQITLTSGANYTFILYAKAAGRTNFRLYLHQAVSPYSEVGVNVDLSAVTVTPILAGGAGTIEAVGTTGYYKITVTGICGTATSSVKYRILLNTTSVGTDSYLGDPTKGIYVFGADIRLSSEASTLPAYQKITSDWPSTKAGNHAFNSSGNSANFPVLSARYNLLTKTEQFDDAVWGKFYATIAADSTSAPDATLTADKLLETAVTNYHWIRPDILNYSAGRYTSSVYAKAGERSWLLLQPYDGPSTAINAYFDLANGVVGTTTAGVSASISPVGNGWYKCSMTYTFTSSYYVYQILIAISDNTASYTGDTSKGIYIWGADLRVANDALNQPAYQRVNTSTDYDTVGFKPYLRFNGTQWLQTNSIDFTYGDKMFVSAGVRKLSDAVRGILVESSASAADLRKFVIDVPNSTTIKYRAAMPGDGTTNPDYGYTASEFSAPHTAVIGAIMDRALFNNSVLMKVNAGLSGSFAYPFSFTNTFGNYPLYIGARAGSSLWFNGRLYQLVIAGKQASASEITNTETFINQKTGAY